MSHLHLAERFAGEVISGRLIIILYVTVFSVKPVRKNADRLYDETIIIRYLIVQLPKRCGFEFLK